MMIPTKTAGNGFSLPMFSLGTWMVGGAMERDVTLSPETEIEGIQRAIEAGVTCIDTAELYAGGYTEELVGAAIEKYTRSKLQIISKVAPSHLKFDDVLRAAENSIRRLKTDYLDVYIIHRPNHAVPLSETMRAMRVLLDRGMIRNVGMSNSNVATLIEAERELQQPIILNQVHYNLIFRQPERCGLLEHCNDRKILLMAWRPVQRGALVATSSDIMRRMMEKYGKSSAQVAINWLISQKNVISLSTMKSSSHLEENLGAIGWSLEDSDIELLRRDFPGQQEVSDREPLI